MNIRDTIIFIFATIILGFILYYPLHYDPKDVGNINKFIILLFGLLSAQFWYKSSIAELPEIRIPNFRIDLDLDNRATNEIINNFIDHFNNELIRYSVIQEYISKNNKYAAICASIVAMATANEAYINVILIFSSK
ncbi:hypothetical protein [Methylobacterium indicum]|uniref:Uncharacterized protein n=1 Tax=Methylobacterium indicum TaxID=1775910 RepID=A0A8H8X0Z9_9HYPH|nr:hypothetical protein [Methylobacterium indicum]BCM88079.1 hypothetical protein mvi_65400 [Methylobacterium indicum]